MINSVDAVNGTVGPLPIGEMKLDPSKIERYYTKTRQCTMRDLIVEVRRLYPNPRQVVIIEGFKDIPTEELKESLIFVKGVNDTLAKGAQGVGPNGYCVVDGDNADESKEDYGITALIEKFINDYAVSQFDVLVYGKNTDKLLKVHETVQSLGSRERKFIFPVGVAGRLQLFANGVDISPIVTEMDLQSQRNALSSDYIIKVLDTLGCEIKNGKTALQNSQESRTLYARWITLCMTNEHSLIPVYLESYIPEYYDTSVGYPFAQLSLFERIEYLRNLPSHVGYIGDANGNQFRCIMKVVEKIVPLPSMVYDLQEGELFLENLEQFDLRTAKLIDYRSTFKSSPTYFIDTSGQSTALAQVSKSDREVDKDLTDMFIDIESKWNSDISLSIKNTVIVEKQGKTYVAFCGEPLGVVGILESDYFGKTMEAFGENSFRNFIDVKIILAINQKEKAQTVAEGEKKFNAIMVNAPETLHPPVPLRVLMCSRLVPDHQNNLSYYDKRLRCDANVLPIITNIDAKLYSSSVLDGTLSFRSVRRDEYSKYSISAFGTVRRLGDGKGFLPISYKSFEGVRLL